MIGKLAKRGFSLFEMVVVVGILALIASASVPVAELTFNNMKEAELENNLERMREAIALWRRDCRNAVVAQIGYDKLREVPFWRLCPPSLEALVNTSLNSSDGIYYDSNGKPVSQIFNEYGQLVATFTPRRYLEAIPIDPFVGRACWLVHVASGSCRAAYGFRTKDGTRGYKDVDFGKGAQGPEEAEPDWHGVFDVSCIPSEAVDADDYYTRRGYNISVDGTLFENW